MIRKPPRKPNQVRFARGEAYIFVNVLREVALGLPPIPFTTPSKKNEDDLGHVRHWMALTRYLGPGL